MKQSMVSTITIVFIVMNIILGIAVPIGMVLYFRKRYQISVKGFFLGCVTMILSALVLEQLVHFVVLASSAGAVIQNNILLYALYGGLMAGLFEETGRFITMRFFMKKQHDDPHNALMYGAGHGGLEMMMILMLANINNLIYAIMINQGQISALMEPLNEASKELLQTSLDQLITTPSWMFLMSPLERLSALAVQLAFSVMVWMAVSQKKIQFSLYFIAILLHAVIDGVAVILSQIGIPVLLVEAAVILMAFLIVSMALGIWMKHCGENRETPET